MKALNFAKVAFLLVVLLTANACSDKNYIDYRNTDEELCNKDWIQDTELDVTTNEWERLTLHFKTNGKYSQSKAYYRNNDSEPYRTINDNNLVWTWADDSKERIILGEKGKYTYFDNVMLRNHYLTGRLDGKEVLFTDYK